MENKKKNIIGKVKPKLVKHPNPEIPRVCGFSDGSDAAISILDMIEKTHRGDEMPPNGIQLDVFPPHGLLPGTLTLISSMPGQGRTAYLANIASELARKERSVAVFLPNLTIDKFVTRMICIRTGLDVSRVCYGFLTREHWASINDAAKQLGQSGVYFSQQTIMSAGDIDHDTTMLAAELKKTGRKLDAVIVDSLNYVKVSGWPNPLSTLKSMAKKLGAAVICSRGLRETENIRDGFVGLGDIRAIGVNEANIDNIYHIRRPCYYNDNSAPKDQAELICVYRNHLRNSTWYLHFNSSSMAFTPWPVCSDGV